MAQILMLVMAKYEETGVVCSINVSGNKTHITKKGCRRR